MLSSNPEGAGLRLRVGGKAFILRSALTTCGCEFGVVFVLMAYGRVGGIEGVSDLDLGFRDSR